MPDLRRPAALPEEMSEDELSGGGQRASIVMQSTANSAANSFSSGADHLALSSITLGLVVCVNAVMCRISAQADCIFPVDCRSVAGPCNHCYMSGWPAETLHDGKQPEEHGDVQPPAPVPSGRDARHNPPTEAEAAAASGGSPAGVVISTGADYP